MKYISNFPFLNAFFGSLTFSFSVTCLNGKGNASGYFFLSYYSCFNTIELHILNNVFQVNDLKMVDEPMDEGEPVFCRVSTHVHLVNIICSI